MCAAAAYEVECKTRSKIRKMWCPVVAKEDSVSWLNGAEVAVLELINWKKKRRLVVLFLSSRLDPLLVTGGPAMLLNSLTIIDVRTSQVNDCHRPLTPTFLNNFQPSTGNNSASLEYIPNYFSSPRTLATTSCSTK